MVWHEEHTRVEDEDEVSITSPHGSCQEGKGTMEAPVDG